MEILRQLVALLSALVMALSSQVANLVNNIEPGSQLAQVAPTSGLVGYWNLNETGGATAGDSSGNSYNGTLVNNPSWVSGRVNNGLNLSGASQYVRVPDASSLHLASTTYSYTFWFRTNNPNTDQGLVGKNGSTGFVSAINTNKVLVGHRINDTSSNLLWGATTLGANTWYHAAVVYDRSTLKIYLNGAEDGSRNVSTDLPDTLGDIFLGSASGIHLNGILDEVRIYNRALSTSEITNIYNEAGSVNPTPTPPPPTPTPPPPTPTPTPPPPSPTPTPTPIPPSTGGNQWYVSPTGSVSGNGSITSPWDLQTALNHPSSVRPGDTVWLRGGTYTQPTFPVNLPTNRTFTSNLNGTSGAPITVRNYSNERVIIDAVNNPGYPPLSVLGSWTNIWGLEITNTSAQRIWGDEYTSCIPACRESILFSGLNNKLINSIVHDGGGGLSFFSAGRDGELYGNLIYYGGIQSSLRGHGHGIYTQNDIGTKRILNNMIFDGFHTGIQAYGTSDATIRNIVIEDNTIFNNGSISRSPNGWGMLIGGNATADDMIVNRNNLYYPTSFTRSNNIDPSYTGGTTNLTLRDNYSAGLKSIDYGTSVSGTFTASGNTFIGQASALAQSQISPTLNSFYGSSSGRPNFTVVRPNIYERGRAHITVFNWNNLSIVSVNLSQTGLASGDAYEIRDVQNYFGTPVLTGTYSSSNPTVSLPMNLTTISPIVGTVPTPPVHTSREFNAFVVLKTGSSSLTTPPPPTPPPTPPPSDITPPIISNLVGSNTTSNSTVISWNTNEIANGQIDYGLTTAYGSQSSLVNNNPRTLTHTIALTNLSSNTIHHFRVRSTDSSNNISQTQDFTFTTLSTSVTPTPTPTPPSPSPTPTPSQAPSSGGGAGAVGSPSSTGSPATTIYIPPSTTNVNTSSTGSYTFTRVISLGSRGTDVTELQKFLVSQSYLTADNVTGYFGKITEAALQQFQRVNNIVTTGTPGTTGYGSVGPSTRARLNSMLSSVTMTTQSSVPTSTSRPITIRLQFRSTGPQVLLLQKVLVQEGLLSADNQTGFFGPLTEAAVKKFQVKYNIVTSGRPDTTGYGAVGPMTRGMLNTLIK